MPRRSAATTAALVVAGLVTLACAFPEPDAPVGPTEVEPTTETTTTATATGTSMEGAYDYNTMDAYVEAVVSDFMNPWLTDTWPGMRTPAVMYVGSGESGLENCTDADGEQGYYTEYSYEYCPGDETVYVGQETLWEFYSETGDAGPAMGIAHEYGHHVQYMLGVRSPRTAAQSVDYENQADCLSGAWARWMDEKGWLETEDDLRDIELMFPIIASAEGEDRDHGTLEEREQAFTEGYLRGVRACGLD